MIDHVGGLRYIELAPFAESLFIITNEDKCSIN